MADLYDDIIEIVLDQLDATELDPREVMDLFDIVEAVNVERKNHGRQGIVLPPALHARIRGFARNGMWKGSGKGEKPKSYLKTLYAELSRLEAKQQKSALLASNDYAAYGRSHTGANNSGDATVAAAEAIIAKAGTGSVTTLAFPRNRGQSSSVSVSSAIVRSHLPCGARPPRMRPSAPARMISHSSRFHSASRPTNLPLRRSS